MVNPFTTVADSLAALIGTTSDIAGFILGFVLVVTLLIILQWTIGERKGGFTTLILSATLGSILSTLVGWFPVWVIIFIVLMVLLVIVKPFGSGAEEA